MNKEQLKEAVGELNLVVTEFEADGVSYIDAAVSVMQVYDLIDQLEEPDKRTQLEEAYKDILERHIFYYNKTKYQVIKEPIIPRFVADWIDAHNLYGNNPLREYRDLENDFNEGWTDEKDASVYHWINKNPYTFIDALRYGYEVEKEKLYRVIIPTKDTECDYYYLNRDGGINMSYELKSVECHTEAFIRSISDELWQFAVEVAE